MTDMINHPPHYKDDSGIECIDIKEHLSSTAGDCFKYLYRCGNKDATTLEPANAKWYAERSQQNGYAVFHPEAPEHIKDMLLLVAKSRAGNIRYAMEGIAAGEWGYVIACISTEIAHCEVV